VSRGAQIELLFGMWFAFGAVAGALSLRGPAAPASRGRRDARIEKMMPPLAGWFALLFPVVLPPVSIGLMMMFC